MATPVSGSQATTQTPAIPPGFEIESHGPPVLAGTPAIPAGFEIEASGPSGQGADTSGTQVQPPQNQPPPGGFSSTGGLPHPDVVDALTTQHAQTLATAVLTRAQMEASAPPVPPAPIPYGLQSDQQRIAGAPTFQNPRTGRIYPRQAPGEEGGPLGVLDSSLTGPAHVAEGVEQMTRPGLRAKAGGLHKAIGGVLETAAPLMAGTGIAAPVATAATLAAGTAAQGGAEWALKKIGIPEEYAAVAGDLVGLFAAAKTPKTIAALKAKYEPVLRARFEAKADVPDVPAATANSAAAEPYRPPAVPAGFEIEKPGAVTAANPGKIESPGATDGERPATAAAAVDAGAARPLDTGGTGEGPAVHGTTPPGPRRFVGKATTVLIPGEDRSIPAHYEARELDDINASHTETFSPNPRYRLKNERDYSKPENQQRLVDQSTEEKFEPRYHINNNPDMANGPPLLFDEDEGPDAIGGNSRVIGAKRVFARDGRKAQAYRDLFAGDSAHYGIDPQAVRGMRKPYLVRVADRGAMDDIPGGTKWAIRKTNVQGQAALSASERAAADAGQMTPEMIGHIAGAIEDAGPGATLNDALTGKSGTVIVNRLISEGFFNEQERPALMDGKTGALTQSAKDRISKALLGKFFRDSDQIARTPASIRNKLERIAAPLAKVAGSPEWDITPDVREAIDLTEYASAHGIRNLGDVVSQTGMFGETPQWSDGAVKLAELLRDGKPNDVVAAFRKYVNSKEPTMFGESTPAEAFRDAFGTEKPTRAVPVAAPPGNTAHAPGTGESGAGADGALAPQTGPHGPVLTQFHHDGAGAIAELRRLQSGDAIGALHHPDSRLGDVDLVWGERGTEAKDFEDGSGIAKLVAKERWDILRTLPDFFSKMRVDEARSGPNRIRLLDDRLHAVVRLDYDGTPKRWLLTAFDDEAPTSGRRTGVPGNPKAGGTPPPIGDHEFPSPERNLDGSGNPVSGDGEPTSPPPGATSSLPAKPAERKSGAVHLGSGLGAFEPFLRESYEDMKALKAKRDAAIAELERSKITEGEKNWGAQVRHFFTGERDLWGARANQGIAKIRKVLGVAKDKRGVDTNAVVATIAREFKKRPGELKAFLDGYHPALLDIDDLFQKKRVDAALAAIRPAMEQAYRQILAGTPEAQGRAADRFYTNMAEMTAAEGKKTGVLDTEWDPETYVPHALHPKGEGEYPGLRKAAGRALGGDIGKHFGFAQRRTYATLLHAIADDVVPKTMDIHDAFTIQQDHFARARATRLLEQQLKDSNIGKYTVRKSAPEGWVQLAPHATEFHQSTSYDTGQIDEEGNAITEIAEKHLYVPKFIAEALKPITAPDFTLEIKGLNAVRVTQAATKAAQLGLSFFHATTENYMALANMGVKGYARALRASRDSGEFLTAERDLIAHGGATSIQGNTVEAYRAMQPGSIPTYHEIFRQNAAVKIMDEAAAAISDFTFANMQRRFKVTDYQLHTAGWMAEHPNATAAELRAAKQGIAKEVNAIYGGLHWENIGLNKSTVEVARALMLAPDWTISNLFNVKYAFEQGPAGSMARMFWARTLVGGMVATQAASLMFSGHFSKRFTMVYMGKDQNGEDIYQNIFFKGAPGDAVNLVNNVHDYGLQGIARTLAGKGSPTVRTGLQLIGNRDFLGHEIAPKGMNPVASSARVAWASAKSLSPIPLSLVNEIDMLFGPEAHKYTWPERLTTLFAGNPPAHVAPAGTHMSNGILRPNAEREENSAIEQMETGQVYKRRGR